MSLAEIEADERERQRGRQKIYRALSWAPLVMSLLMLAVGGLSLWAASSGHEADQSEVADLVDEHQTEAQQAQEESHADWSQTLQDSSGVSAQRLDQDSEAMHTLLSRSTGGDDTSMILATSQKELPAAFDDLAHGSVPGLRDAITAQLGPVEPILVDIDGGAYSYFAFVEVYEDQGRSESGQAQSAAVLSVEWSCDTENMITELDAHWVETISERS